MLKKLAEVIKLAKDLRCSDTPCAWTQAQTFNSLSKHTLEETCELIDAIVQKDYDAIKDELGDLLYHVIFYAQMAQEQSQFNLADVAQSILEKRKRRQPDPAIRQHMSAEQINAYWQQAKNKEKTQSGNTSEKFTTQWPALIQAMHLLKQADKTGFSWPNIKDIFDKIQEEIAELIDALQHKPNEEQLQEEYGDLLLACISLGKHLNINPEIALIQANNKFSKRLHFVAENARADKKIIEAVDQKPL